jgi:alpha-L-fucosidase 2
MLLQSQADTVRVFPAVPPDWADVSFESLRAAGAFLVSARKAAGRVVEVRITSEKGGRLRLADPFSGGAYEAKGTAAGAVRSADGVIEIEFRPGQEIRLRGHRERGS